MFQPLVHLNYTVSCAICPTGLYIDDPATIDIMHSSVASCLACPKGREFVNRTFECAICDAGRFQNSSTKPGAMCSSCPSGRYLLDTEDTAAALEACGCRSVPCACPKGREFVNRTSECAICAAGRFQNSSTTPGASVLILSFGRYLLDTEDTQAAEKHVSVAQCLTCPKGREFVNRTSECAICAAGRFQNSSTKPGAVCSSCPSGRYLLDTEDTQAAEKHVRCRSVPCLSQGSRIRKSNLRVRNLCRREISKQQQYIRCSVLILPFRSIPT